MLFAKKREVSAVVVGVFFIYAADWVFAHITRSIPRNNLYLMNFTDQELQSIFLATCYLVAGFATGVIARRRGFLLGFMAATFAILIWYARAALRYPPALVSITVNCTVLLKILAWGLQAGVGGVVGVLFAVSQSAKNLVAKYWAVR